LLGSGFGLLIPARATCQTLDADMVIILFDAAATAKDGIPYRNTYTWYFQMKEVRIIKAIAFFGTRDFDKLWNRVSPDHRDAD
jgi:ketosteroid isomerase-like protein